MTEPVVCYRGYGDKQTSDKPYSSQMNNRAKPMKVITTVNQTEGKDLQEPIRIQSKITKLPEAQENVDFKS